jgi:hypothetical protein
MESSETGYFSFIPVAACDQPRAVVLVLCAPKPGLEVGETAAEVPLLTLRKKDLAGRRPLKIWPGRLPSLLSARLVGKGSLWWPSAKAQLCHSAMEFTGLEGCSVLGLTQAQ